MALFAGHRVAQLRDRRLDLRATYPTHAALILKIFEAQWAHAGFPIDDRPEILATLYNIGYGRSRPNGAPRANDFGRRVAEFIQSKACRDIFNGNHHRQSAKGTKTN